MINLKNSKKYLKKLLNNKNMEKKKNKNLGWIALVLLVLGGGGTFAYFTTNKEQSVVGFEGVGETIDSLSIIVPDEEPIFDITKISAIRDQINAGNPIEDIESFRKAFEENIKQAEKDNLETIIIPSVQVMFELAKGELTSEAQELIAEYAKSYLKTTAQPTIIVEGYACNLGNDKVNDKISKQRAEAVKNVLISNGISADKVDIAWYGKKKFNQFHFSTKEKHRRATINIK